MESDTPRTDQVFVIANSASIRFVQQVIDANFARTLERELAAMTAERDVYAQQVQRLTDELRAATRGAQ